MPHVIIADDNKEFRALLATFCLRAGWTVEICGNGAELMDVVMSGTEPGLLLIDIMMPVLDGIEAIERICAQDRPLRVRFMSGGDSGPLMAAKLIASARDMSVGRNIFKPVTRAEILCILEQEAEHLSRLAPCAGKRP
ncbi:response regulator [Salipiger aestuarii]|uniref:Response regulator receiver domain-containing protein n=1 Tax=Salipiger aestuarii TaxID=568098 RepID=A0A327Y6J1_9RHOB|nr:response regulator [Salipiger aestuarii]EIE52350.1 response regulator [Citreicella sp. 357]RAK14069.1 response regulator receiver domain-containing protein [Salipiger aestuarii]